MTIADTDRSGLARPLAVLAAIFLLAGGTSGLQAQEIVEGRQGELSPQEVQELRAEIRDRGNRVLIGFKPVDRGRGVTEGGRRLLDDATVRELSERFRAGPIVRAHRTFDLIPAVAAEIDPSRLEALLASPRVDYVEPEILHETTGGVREAPPRLPAQSTPWGVARVNAPAIWSTTKGSGAKIGIIDTGIDEDHPDLNPVGGLNAVTDGTARADWNDATPRCDSHGTHVAGSAAALDNGSHVVGVAPEAELYAIRVFDPDAAGFENCVAATSHIINGIDWAVTEGLDVINLSLGSSTPSIAQADALAAALAAGTVPVASAGNDGADLGFPGAFPSTISVGAIDDTDAIASFSNRGPELEVSAPGVSIPSTTNPAVTGSETGLLSGTSMASPHAAGVATLMRAADPSVEVDEIRSVLRSTADETVGPNASGYDELSGDGVVLADASVSTILGGASLAVDPAGVHLAADPGGSTASTTVQLRNTGDVTVNWSLSSSESWLSASATSGSLAPGNTSTLTITADPSGIAERIHTGFLTFSGFDNAPLELRTRFAVAPSVPVDATQETAGSIASGATKRFRFTATAGQAVDIAVVPGASAPRLSDPEVRIYAPDGERALTLNDDAPEAGIGFGSLVAGFTPSSDGEYFIEVRVGGSTFGSGPFNFLVLARQSGPIIGFEPGATVRNVRARATGSPVTESIDIVNLGTGTLDWSASTSAPWLSLTPSSGTTTTSSTDVSAVKRPQHRMLQALLERGPDRADLPHLRRLLQEEYEYRAAHPQHGPYDAEPRASSSPTASSVTLEVDQSGLSPDDLNGQVTFSTPADWLAPHQVQNIRLRVFDAGFSRFSDHPWGGLDSKTNSRSWGVTFPTGEVLPVNADGTVGAAVTTVSTSNGCCVGLEQRRDGDWIAMPNNTLAPLKRVSSSDGSVSDHASVPGFSIEPAVGPNDELYAPSFSQDQLYEVSPDGSTVTALGSPITGDYGAAFRPGDGQVYVSAVAVDAFHRVDPSDGSSTALLSNSDFSYTTGGNTAHALPAELEVGASGTIYALDLGGRLWSIDPDAPSVSLVAWTPFNDQFASMSLVDGKLVVGAQTDFAPDGTPLGGGYFLATSDGPIGIGESGGSITADLDASGVDQVVGKPFTLPLRLDLTGTSETAAGYNTTMTWNAGQLGFNSVSAGSFGGSFTSNTNDVGTGTLRVSSARSDGVSGTTVLYETQVSVDLSVAAGTQIDVSMSFSELVNPSSEDLLPQLTVQDASLCVSDNPFGDVNTDGSIGTGDVVQILRNNVGLSLASGVDLSLADVDDDGSVGTGDAVQVLRDNVGLSIPSSSRLGLLRVTACP